MGNELGSCSFKTVESADWWAGWWWLMWYSHIEKWRSVQAQITFMHHHYTLLERDIEPMTKKCLGNVNHDDQTHPLKNRTNMNRYLSINGILLQSLLLKDWINDRIPLPILHIVSAQSEQFDPWQLGKTQLRLSPGWRPLQGTFWHLRCWCHPAVKTGCGRARRLWKPWFFMIS